MTCTKLPIINIDEMKNGLPAESPGPPPHLLRVVGDGPEPLLIPLQLCLADLAAIEKLKVLLGGGQ